MNLRKTIKDSGATQEAVASALGVAMSTLQTWMNGGIPHESAALARMWCLGLAYLRRSGDGWKIVPAGDLAARYLAAFDIIAMATNHARGLILSAEGGVAKKDSLSGQDVLTVTGRPLIVPTMRTTRAQTGKRYPGEKAAQTGVFLYPSQKEALIEKAKAEGLSMGDAVRQAIEIWMDRRGAPQG